MGKSAFYNLLTLLLILCFFIIFQCDIDEVRDFSLLTIFSFKRMEIFLSRDYFAGSALFAGQRVLCSSQDTDSRWLS